MKSFIEEFYYGNIEPQELSPEFGSSLKKKLNSLVKNEDEFREKLTDEEKKMFQQYTNLYNEFLSISIADSFISGFRLGAKFTHDVFVK
jgi:hypothetical protein